MDNLDTAAMVQRFQERAKAVRQRNMPPIAGLERKAFVKQAELDYQDFAMIADAEISLDEGILTIDLRPAICDAAIRGMAPLERETQVAMENISKSEHRTYDDVMEAQREKREALIEDEDRPSMLRVVETIEPIDVNACPGLDLANYDDPIERIVPIQRVPTERISTPGFSLTHGYLV
jgi:hypothetical protein